MAPAGVSFGYWLYSSSGLAMITIRMAKGINEWRQHKNSRHCEEERRGNLPHFFLRLPGYAHKVLSHWV